MSVKKSKPLTSELVINQGSEDGVSISVAIIVASYNSDIAQGLLDGCLRGLSNCSVKEKNISIYETDGAFELPVLAKKACKTADVVICLGAVIKGDTAHFEYVAGPCADGIQQVSLEMNTPVIFGVLTTYTEEQAQIRAKDDDFNKGYEAACTAVKTATLLKLI